MTQKSVIATVVSDVMRIEYRLVGHWAAITPADRGWRNASNVTVLNIHVRTGPGHGGRNRFISVQVSLSKSSIPSIPSTDSNLTGPHTSSTPTSDPRLQLRSLVSTPAHPTGTQ